MRRLRHTKKALEEENSQLQAENARLLDAVGEAKAERREEYEGWMLEQKRAILELAERLQLSEGEARYYEDREETSEELRRLILDVAYRSAEMQVTWKDIKKVEVWTNTLVARIALAGGRP